MIKIGPKFTRQNYNKAVANITGHSDKDYRNLQIQTSKLTQKTEPTKQSNQSFVEGLRYFFEHGVIKMK